MKKVFFALLQGVAPSVVFMLLGGHILTGESQIAEGASQLMSNVGLTRTGSGWLLIAAGVVTLLLTLGRMLPLMRQFRMKRALADTGVCVRAVVTDVKRVAAYKERGRSSVRLTLRCTPPSGVERELVSPLLWAPELRIGDGVDVIFDPADESRWFIRLKEERVVRDPLDQPPRL